MLFNHPPIHYFQPFLHFFLLQCEQIKPQEPFGGAFSVTNDWQVAADRLLSVFFLDAFHVLSKAYQRPSRAMSASCLSVSGDGKNLICLVSSTLLESFFNSIAWPEDRLQTYYNQNIVKV